MISGLRLVTMAKVYEQKKKFGNVVPKNPKMKKKPKCKIWLFQVVQWVFICVVPARFICLGVVYALRFKLLVIAMMLSSSPIGKNPQLELFFVMLAGPLVMNSIQYLMQDYVLKSTMAVNFLRRSMSQLFDKGSSGTLTTAKTPPAKTPPPTTTTEDN